MAHIKNHNLSLKELYASNHHFVHEYIKIQSGATLYRGDNMNSKKMLTSVLHTVQMGQSGIKSVENYAIRPALKQQLQKQRSEYDALESAARQLAQRHNWELKDISPGILKMSDMMARMRLMGGERDSKIAGMLIQGNTRGMILGMKNLRKGKKADENVQALTQRLVAQEKASIKSSQPFL